MTESISEYFGEWRARGEENISRADRLREIRQENINGIRTKLERGTYFIKEGHKVKDLNPEGVAMEVPLSVSQIERLQEHLEILTYGPKPRLPLKRLPSSSWSL